MYQSRAGSGSTSSTCTGICGASASGGWSDVRCTQAGTRYRTQLLVVPALAGCRVCGSSVSVWARWGVCVVCCALIVVFVPVCVCVLLVGAAVAYLGTLAAFGPESAAELSELRLLGVLRDTDIITAADIGTAQKAASLAAAATAAAVAAGSTATPPPPAPDPPSPLLTALRRLPARTVHISGETERPGVEGRLRSRRP